MPRRFCLEGGTLLRKKRLAPAADESAMRGVSPPGTPQGLCPLVLAP